MSNKAKEINPQEVEKIYKESFESALVSKNYTAQVQTLKNLGHLYLEKKNIQKQQHYTTQRNSNKR
ncbi:hypothetical protein H1Q59_07505 [Holosporaceae bacterium 'Namur']|nr:hypothetical protein [Holosporaceae bacterium 'Namur']